MHRPMQIDAMDHDPRPPQPTNRQDEPTGTDSDPETNGDSLTAVVLAFLLLPLLSAAAAASAGVELRRSEPGPEAAAAYELFESEATRRTGCEAFFDQLTEGTTDPWTFRGAVLCAAEVRGFRQRTLAVLRRLPQDSGLVLFARGYLHLKDQEFESAEEMLRQAVTREPELALAWDALGSAIRGRGDAAAAMAKIEEALRLAPELDPAQRNLQQARLHAEVFDRLPDLLAAIPERWENLGEPLIPTSGRAPYEIQGTFSANQRAHDLITMLTILPIEYRAAFIDGWLEVHEPTEVDLWLPAAVADEEQIRSVTEAALTIEAWLQWAEAAGRRDALFYAAGMGLYLADLRGDVGTLLPIARSWAQLPAHPGTRFGRAHVAVEYASLLEQTGDHTGSLAAYRKARILYQAEGDEFGESRSWAGEALVLARSGHNEEALAAYRKARVIFQAEGTKLSEGNTWVGEARLLFRLGDNEGALAAYRKARTLYRTASDQLGEGNTWSGEADVLFHLGDNEGSLAAYRKARTLFQTVGSRFNEGGTWSGEADVLSRLGHYEGSLAAYREARSLARTVDNKVGEGSSWRGEAEVLLFLGNGDGSLAACRKARTLSQAVGDTIGIGNSWLTEGDALLWKGEKKGSLAAFRRARSLFQAMGDKGAEGWSWRGEAVALFWLGRIEESLAAYRKARAFFAAVDDKFGKAKTWQGEGELLTWMGKKEESLAAFEEARSLFQAVGDKAGEGASWRGEADALYLLGQNEESLTAYRKARVLAQAVGDKAGESSAWTGQALVLYFLDRNEEALDACEAAREPSQAVVDRLGEGDSRFYEGKILFKLQEVEPSLKAYRKARELYQAVGVTLGEGNTWLGEGDVFSRQGKNDTALVAYRKARALFRTAGSRLGEGNSWVDEGDIFLDQGEYERALAAYREARALFQAVGDRLGEGNTIHGEAEILWRQGDYRLAAEHAEAAIRLYEQSEVASNRINALLVETWARSMLAQSRRTETLALEAIRLHEDRRRRFITDQHRTAVDQRIYSAYHILISIIATEPGRAAEALTYAEKARSRVLLDLLATGPVGGKSSSPLNLARERTRLQRRLEEVEYFLNRATDPKETTNVEAERRQLERELKWIEYREMAADGHTLAIADPLDATGIQALAVDTGPILLYFAVDNKLIGFFVLPDQIHVTHVDVAWGDLKETVGLLAYYLANPSREILGRPLARVLWDLLVDPFVKFLPAGDRLTIIPHGPLHRLPFEALLDSEGQLLHERWNLTIAPSASVLEFARRRHQPAQKTDSFAAFTSGRGLRLTSAEGEEIAGFFGDETATFDFTDAHFRYYELIASRARHLLISTRGVHNSDGDGRWGSYLEIRPTRELHDSRLRAAEIATIPIAAELVTLAACDTAAGQALLSDERLDLTRAFLVAGAAAVLATRWKVPEDVATSRFLIDFYRAYRRGGPDGEGMRKDEALTLARRRSRERGDPAQVWAAWTLVGDPR